MRLSEIIRYYSRPEICQELIRLAQDREVAVKFKDAGFGRRPDIIQFPQDIIGLVRNGATSFHASEELWSDPMQLSPNMDKKELDKLRIGFDLLLDVDCDIVEWSKIAAGLLLEALQYHDINCASLKFSGGTGFHIAIPHTALKLKQKFVFPDTPRIVAEYLKEFIKPHLGAKILEAEKDIKSISEKSGKKTKDLIDGKEFNPFSVLEIDTILISSRHLFRMPYSLHEKRWLASIPIKQKDLENFNIDSAKPENIEEIDNSFLNAENTKAGEASGLLVQAFDWKLRSLRAEDKKEKRTFESESKVPKELFPPCMKIILSGLEDGRKRSIFALANFLKCAGWDWTDIEKELKQWNEKNAQPLKSSYLTGQLKWHQKSARIPPPNCRSFYEDFCVCKPDRICQRIKNPLSYSFFRQRSNSKKQNV